MADVVIPGTMDGIRDALISHMVNNKAATATNRSSGRFDC